MENGKFLTSAGSYMEADIMESLLNSYDIPVLRKKAGAGSYMKIYMGGSMLGEDIYVPNQLFEKAKEIIDQNHISEDEDEDEDEEENRRFKRKKIINGTILLLLIVPGLIVIFVMFIQMLIDNFF